jgi:hypothetical protein
MSCPEQTLERDRNTFRCSPFKGEYFILSVRTLRSSCHVDKSNSNKEWLPGRLWKVKL